MAGRGTRLALLWVCTLLGWAATTVRADVGKEYKIKAAFLYNFTKFVEWPAVCFASDDAPIVIGVVGENPFGGELEKAIHDRKVNGRGLVVCAVRSAADLRRVHVVFAPQGEERQLEAWGGGKTPGVLTVGESARFAALSGMVTFTMAGDKLRFELNTGAAERAGLKVSAQLQKLATAIRR